VGAAGGVTAEEVADLVQHDLLLMDRGQARLVDDEVLALRLDQQTVGASERQGRSHDLERTTTQPTEPLTQSGYGELLLVGQAESADTLRAPLSEVAVLLIG
jgi:hypothetical protein